MNKNILIVSPFFERKYNYMEVQIADTLHYLGYNVTVLTSNKCMFNSGTILDDSVKYNIIRIKKLIRISDTIYPLVNLRDIIQSVDPFLVFLIYPSTGLPYFIMKYLQDNCAVISTFEDRYDKNKFTIKTKIIRKLLKYNWYKKVFDRSNIIAVATNQTAEIFRSHNKFKDVIGNKIRIISLGYDPKIFFYNESLRKKIRSKYNIRDGDIVLITATRIIRTKPVKNWLKPIINALEKNPRLLFMLIGFLNNSYSADIKNWIGTRNKKNRIILVDLLSAEKLNEYFNCADYSIWFTPTISILQSMGTGLKIIIPKRDTLDHLMKNNANCIYYNSYQELENIFVNLKSNYNREEIFEYNKEFSYENILLDLIHSLDENFIMN